MRDKKKCGNCKDGKQGAHTLEKSVTVCPLWQRSPHLWLDILPTELGDYHYTFRQEYKSEIVRLKTGRMLSFMGSVVRVPIDGISGYFQGPITPEG